MPTKPVAMNLSEAIAFTCQVKPTWGTEGKGAKTALTNVRHCLSIIGDKPVDSITAGDFVKIQQVAIKVLGKKNATANRWTRSLATVLHTLKGQGRMAGEVPCFKALPESEAHITSYSEQDLERMLNTCFALPDGQVLYDFLKFAALTGAKPFEVLSLQWGDVFLVDQQLVLKGSKHGHDRWLPITSMLMRHLRKMVASSVDHRVFAINQDLLLAQLHQLQQMAGIHAPRLKKFHALRPSAANRLFASPAEKNQ